MEDKKDQFILILAGYQKEMESFLLTNPGLRSRFPIHIDFEDYSKNELMQIADQFCGQRQYKMAPETKSVLFRILNSSINTDTFGNARTVRNIIEKAIRKQAVRLMNKSNITREDLIIIQPEDIGGGD